MLDWGPEDVLEHEADDSVETVLDRLVQKVGIYDGKWISYCGNQKVLLIVKTKDGQRLWKGSVWIDSGWEYRKIASYRLKSDGWKEISRIERKSA